MSDIVSDQEAKNYAFNRLLEGTNRNIAFEATMQGTTLLEPGQLISVNLPDKHINGVYNISAIVHELNFTDGVFTTQLNFTRPSGKFRNMIRKINKAARDVNNIRTNNKYDSAASLGAGLDTSLGAYS